jgi:uncharacterized protein YjdB
VGSHTGSITGTAVGTTTVTAALSGITSNTANINVTAATLSSIAITPASVTLAKDTNTNLSAIGTFSDGSSSDISTQVTWTSASTATATVGLHTGRVAGVAVGSTTAYASLNGITSPDANITVTDATLISIAITTGATLPKGTNANLLAIGTYSDSTTADITTHVTWISDDPLTATIGSHTGIVIGTEIGATTVTATLSGIPSNTASINVIAATLSSIAITPASVSLVKSTHAHLIATGTYSDASTANLTTQVTWTSNAPAKASVGINTGIVTGVAEGSTTVFAALDGVNSPTVSITVTPIFYATWNPADKGPTIMLNATKLTASSYTDYESVRATVGISSGTAFWEITPGIGDGVAGIMDPLANVGSYIGLDPATGWGLYFLEGKLIGNGKNPGWVNTPITTGTVIGFGLDMDAGTLHIWVDGVDKGIAFTGLTGTIYPATTIYAGSNTTANFGATPFAYPKAGYDAGVYQH